MLPALPFWQAISRLADRLATKVNKGEPRQRRLAGVLAFTLLWGSLALLAALLFYSAELPLVIQGLAFYLAFSDPRPGKLSAVESLAKVPARELLGSVLKRDCSRYSQEGIYKAAIEGRWRVTKERLLLVLLLAFGAGLPAFLIRAWWVIGDRWHPARPGFGDFGKALVPIAWLCRALGAPLALFWTVLALKPSALFSREKPRQMAMLATALGCQLGGPLLIGGHKISRERVGPGQPADAATLRRLGILAMGGESATFLLVALTLVLVH